MCRWYSGEDREIERRTEGRRGQAIGWPRPCRNDYAVVSESRAWARTWQPPGLPTSPLDSQTC